MLLPDCKKECLFTLFIKSFSKFAFPIVLAYLQVWDNTKEMKVTIIQQNIVWNNVAANLKEMARLIKKAEKADIYLFPEMCSTGFCMQPQGVAEPVDGPTVQQFRLWAKEYDAAIAGTVMTRESDAVYRNRMYFVTPDGAVRYYDKCHLFEYSGEDKVYTPGDKKVIWEWRGVRVRPVICYDIRFPIFLHNKGDYDMLLISANFPESRMLAWDTLIRARAIENQCYVAASNRVGSDGFGTYVGHSVILNPYGQEIARCRSRYQGSATAGLEWEMMERLRRNFPVLENDKEL